MNLLRTSVLSAATTVLKMSCGLVVNKAIALTTGPVGVAAVGQFMNFTGMVQALAGGAMANGVVTLAADRSPTAAPPAAVLRLALRALASAAGLCALGVAFAPSAWLAHLAAPDTPRWVFVAFAITLPLYVGNILVLAYLNGRGSTVAYLKLSLWESVAGLLLAVPLVYYGALTGALVALVASQSLVFLMLWLLPESRQAIRETTWRGDIPKPLVRTLGGLTLMAIVSGLATPGVQLYLRDHIMHRLSPADAGYWQACLRVSQVYMAVITMSLNVYYLPKLSACVNAGEIRREIHAGFRLLLPLILALGVVLMISKNLVLRAMYTGDFTRAGDLLIWQWAGDSLRLASYLFGYLFWARAKVALFIASEIGFALLYAAIAYGLVEANGVTGVVQAQPILYALYLAFSYRIYRRELRKL